jgi:hypothetical protein
VIDFRVALLGALALLSLGLGCNDESVPEAPEPDAGVHQEVAPPLPEFYPRGLTATSLLGEAHGLKPLRTIIHAHTIYSHDACDGQPILADGQPNEPCLASFREALCTDHIDVVMLTEHYSGMAAELDFEKLFLQREGDEWVIEDGRKVANAVVCDDGHRALIVPGLEGSGGHASALGLFAHPVQGNKDEITAAYQDASAEGIQAIRDQGGVPVAIHLENMTLDWLKSTDLDAVEVGNLHILIAPDIRKEVGLDPGAPILALTEWLFSPDEHPNPDFVFLEFHERLDRYHEWWDELLQEKLITGFAGNDVHQNVLEMAMADGDRPDSYRRMMKWYSNYVLVADAAPSSVRKAIAQGRVFMVFEILGSPAGLDFRAESAGTNWLMGDTVPESARTSAAGLRLVAPVPAAMIDQASVATEPHMRLFRISESGSQKVVEVDGALDYVVTEPGRYRLEIFVKPTHLMPYLKGHPELIRELPWIYSNPIEIH